MILIIICAAFANANALNTAPTKLDSSYKSDFRLNNNIVRFGAGGSYGKVASDREAINNNIFRTFKTFRNGAIGMFVAGSLFFTSPIIPLSILTAVILTEADVVGASSAAITTAFQAATLYLPGIFTCIAFLALSGIFLTCGIAFAVVAGVFYHKWAEQRGIISYNSLSDDKPQFAQGFSISL